MMVIFGPLFFFAFILASFASLAAFVAFRMLIRPPPLIADQEPFTMLSRTSQSAVEMMAATDGADRPGRLLDRQRHALAQADEASARDAREDRGQQD